MMRDSSEPSPPSASGLPTEGFDPMDRASRNRVLLRTALMVATAIGCGLSTGVTWLASEMALQWKRPLPVIDANEMKQVASVVDQRKRMAGDLKTIADRLEDRYRDELDRWSEYREPEQPKAKLPPGMRLSVPVKHSSAEVIYNRYVVLSRYGIESPFPLEGQDRLLANLSSQERLDLAVLLRSGCPSRYADVGSAFLAMRALVGFDDKAVREQAAELMRWLLDQPNPRTWLLSSASANDRLISLLDVAAVLPPDERIKAIAEVAGWFEMDERLAWEAVVEAVEKCRADRRAGGQVDNAEFRRPLAALVTHPRRELREMALSTSSPEHNVEAAIASLRSDSFAQTLFALRFLSTAELTPSMVSSASDVIRSAGPFAIMIDDERPIAVNVCLRWLRAAKQSTDKPGEELLSVSRENFGWLPEVFAQPISHEELAEGLVQLAHEAGFAKEAFTNMPSPVVRRHWQAISQSQ